MKNISLFITGLAVVALAGCSSMGENTKKGAGIGALTGAVIGGVVGHQDGHGWQGALIGGAAGATAGGVIGNQADKNAAGGASQGAAQEYLSISQVIEMSKQGVDDEVIIDEIRRTKSSYSLNSGTISYLKENGVSDRVIDAMLSGS